MARVTVEDCVEVVTNRFDLVILAAQRSREVSAGAQLTRERDDDKNPVVALREIAERTVDTGELKDSLISSLQKHIESDEPEEDEMNMLVASEGWGASAEPSSETATDGGIELGATASEMSAAEEVFAASPSPDAAEPATPAEIVPDADVFVSETNIDTEGGDKEVPDADDDSTPSGGL